ncbi:MAG TPA: hypothetical protein G4O11_07550 [Anaerolineae bacterium]|nr:hypothetical protein [Anaerolineae bacterium]
MSTITLYIGFSAVMGILLRRAFSKLHRHPYLELAIAHGLLFFLPTSILLLGHPDWPISGRISLVSIGFTITILSIIQPRWLPSMIWRRTFGHRYFTVALALVVLWGVSTILETRTFEPILISIPACLAGFASWQTSLRLS